MKTPWDPNECNIANAIKQVVDGALGHYVGQNFDNKCLVTITEKLILNTSLFAQQYGNWKCWPAGDRKGKDFETFWMVELDLWHETTRTTAQVGYAGQIVETESGDEYEKAEKAYDESLKNFGAVNRDNAAVFSNLTATNAQMANKIAAAVQSLQ